MNKEEQEIIHKELKSAIDLLLEDNIGDAILALSALVLHNRRSDIIDFYGEGQDERDS